MAFLPLVYGDGVTPDKRSDVAWLQRRLNDVLPAAERIKTDGVYGDATATAVVKVLGLPGTGTSDQEGKVVGGNQWGALERLWIKAVAAGVPGPEGPQGPQGPAGPRGPKGQDAPVPSSFVPVYE